MDRRRAWERAHPKRARQQRADANRRWRRKQAAKGLVARLNKLPGIEVERVLVGIGVPGRLARELAIQRTIARSTAQENDE